MIKASLELYDKAYDTKLYSSEVEDLLMLTAATESDLGAYLMQMNNGPAEGIYQMEPIAKQQSNNRSNKVFGLPLIWRPYCLETQTVFARLYYTSFPEPIPARKDYVSEDDYWWALAVYYKKYWNTEAGANTIERAYNDSKHFVWG